MVTEQLTVGREWTTEIINLIYHFGKTILTVSKWNVKFPMCKARGGKCTKCMGAAFKAFPHSNTDMKVNRRQNTLLSTKTLNRSKFVMNLWDTPWDNLFKLKWIFVCANVSSSLWKTWKIFWSARWLMFPVNASQFQNEPPRNGTNDDFQEIWKGTLF